ncbi:MAG: carbon-nitrogen hydrolase family protein, partial [Bacteroidota bacterium]
MKICVAQIRPYKGDVQKNINKQLKLAKEASQLGAELIVFPELSTTGYEPELAEQLATDVDDEIFNSIQEQANTDRITIGVGMPTKADDGINISMLIFQPNKNRLVYSKRLLHADELPYFARSDNPPFLNIKGHKIALGICYETLQREHFLNAKEHNADIFIASVAKPDRGTDKAYMHFPSVAKEFNI